MRSLILVGIGLLTGCLSLLSAQEPDLRQEALQALKKATTYYREKVARHGGYVYFTSLDLQERWGEGKAGPETIFVQPPGTPTVGMAYLKAFQATGDAHYREAARETAGALMYGQLQSGGWTQTIHFTPNKQAGRYRNGKGGSRNTSSLDDDQTQSALIFLMRLDQALEFKDAKVHEAVTYGLDSLLRAQFASGAFPQVWVGPVTKPAPGKAKYPEYDWKTEGRVKNYWDYATLNDNLAGTVSEVLIEAHAIYGEKKYRAALERLGDFLIAAQMPDPQPGWCQQYNDEMIPMWARKFEPPAVSGSESQDAMRTLVKITRITGEKKYLEPIPRALAYFKKCLLPDGRVARFYELRTNKPLYMDAQYRLTYDDSTAPAHYGWKQPAHLDAIEKAYQDARNGVAPPRRQGSRDLEARVRQVLKDLDAEGRWISTYQGERLVGQPKFPEGFRYLSSDVFSRNVELLAEFVAITRK